MSMPSKIKIIENTTGETMYEFSFEESEAAQIKATELDEMGLDISLKIPTVTQTLCDTLGIENEDLLDYEESVVAEIDDHNH